MDEFELIDRFFARDGECRGLAVGIGDDGAVLQPDPGLDLVTVVDTLVEGVHFHSQIAAADLGYRAVVVNLSDIAAMGAGPRWMTLALTLPEADHDWLEQFAQGLFEAADEHDVALVGGDMTSGNNIIVTVQITGDVASGTAMLRSGARPGDSIYVTGTIGDAAGGLELIRADRADDILAPRFLRPTARVGCGRRLAGVASAAIDISDGLYGDLLKLLRASGAGGEVNLDAVPVSAALRRQFDTATVRRLALGGGDDYELCFTSSQPVPAEVAGVPVTKIGTVTESAQLLLRDADGIVPFDDSGYLHFQ